MQSQYSHSKQQSIIDKEHHVAGKEKTNLPESTTIVSYHVIQEFIDLIISVNFHKSQLDF